MSFFIGIDLVEIKRINSIIDKSGNTFLNRIYTKTEQEYCNSNANPSIHFAGRFAAKEAVKKSILSSGIKESISLKSIEIDRKKNGEPYISKVFKNGWLIKVSISHTDDYATAFAICFPEWN
jgi:holo-[acyl-carrier protein] synthase